MLPKFTAFSWESSRALASVVVGKIVTHPVVEAGGRSTRVLINLALQASEARLTEANKTPFGLVLAWSSIETGLWSTCSRLTQLGTAMELDVMSKCEGGNGTETPFSVGEGGMVHLQSIQAAPEAHPNVLWCPSIQHLKGGYIRCVR